MQAYGRQARDSDLIDRATEIRLRAERKLGALLAEQKATVGMATGGEHGGRKRIDGSREEPSIVRPTLAEVGVDKKLSCRARRRGAGQGEPGGKIATDHPSSFPQAELYNPVEYGDSLNCRLWYDSGPFGGVRRKLPRACQPRDTVQICQP